jgi:hypothetical protein
MSGGELSSTPQAAPFLFSEQEMQALEVVELRDGKYTGERLATRRPHVYQLVVKLLGEKWSVNSICEVCGVHPYTVAAVGAREGISIEEHKRVSVNGLAFTSRMLIERLMELAPTAENIKDVAVALGIAVEKLQLLSGGATSRVEGLDGTATNPFADWLATAKPADVRVIDAAAREMGSDGATDLQSGPRSGDGSEGVPPAGTDTQSDDSTGSDSVKAGTTPDFATDFPTNQPGPGQGGRGSEI